MKKIYLYTRYERAWHWLQIVFILILLITGMEIYGIYPLLGFKLAAKLHNYIGITWLIAFAFFIFWLFTTGEWKQYIPTTQKMFTVIMYYSCGIFRGEPHPVPKTKDAKHNPLQRLTYLFLAAFLLPMQMLSGLLYYNYNKWAEYGFDFLSLEIIAAIHVATAFAILSFFIVHVYMTTTGHSIFTHLKAMITGWEHVQDHTKIEKWEEKDIE